MSFPESYAEFNTEILQLVLSFLWFVHDQLSAFPYV